MKKYCINVEGLSVEEKEEILECLYKLGYSWEGCSFTGANVKYYVTDKESINWGNTLIGIDKHEQYLITPQQLKQEALMSNPMPKLEAGKHVVKLKSGRYYLVLESAKGDLVGTNLSFNNGCLILSENERGTVWEVIEVHPIINGSFNDIFYYAQSKQGILWEKLTPEQIKLKQEIADAQEKVSIAQEALKEAQSVLKGLKSRQ